MEIEEKADNPLTGQSELLSQMDLIAIAQLIKAKKGDTSTFSAILDRLEGKPKQAVDALPDKKITINVIKGEDDEEADSYC